MAAFRVLSVVLLGSAVLLVVIASRGGPGGTQPYIPAAVRKVPRALHLLWFVVSVLVPFAALVLAVVVPQLIHATALNIAFPGDVAVQLAALGFFAAGGGLLVWSNRHLGRYMVVDIAVATDHELITTGPYAYIRHPTYTGVLLVSLATALFVLHVAVIVNFFLVLAFAIWRARMEEELLASEQGFGSRYQEYVRRTGRFFPRSFRGFE